MSKQIHIAINLTDNLGITSAVITHNDTDITSDSKLIQNVAWALLKSIHLNKDDLKVQDLMNELEIELTR